MIFPFTNENTNENNKKSLYKFSKNWIIKRIEGTENYKYIIHIDGFPLKLESICGDFKVNRNGAIEFLMTKETKRLNFFKIIASVKKDIEARLYMEVRGPGFYWIEWSIPFTVISKKNKKSSIEDRKSTKNLTNNHDDLIRDLFDKSNMEFCSIKDIDDDYAFKESIDGTVIVTTMFEENQPCISKSIDMKYGSTTYCLAFNQIDFYNNPDKKRPRSIKNVYDIVRIFHNKCQCETKIMINATKNNLLEYIKEFIPELLISANQVIVFVMSHGQCGGFFTSDNELVTEKEFHNSLMPIMRHRDIKVMILLAACRTYTVLPLVAESNHNRFYLTTRSISSSDESTEGEDSPVSIRPSMDETSLHPNVILGYSTMPGEVSFGTEDGSLYINKILIKFERGLKKDGRVECVDIINKVNKDFKFIPIILDGKKVTQQPCKNGDISDGLWFDLEGKNMDSEEDILGLTNFSPLEMDII